MVNESNLYNRQSTLNLNIPTTAAVIGVGGVGSWVALDLAMVGVRELYLYDFDIIEDSNLNRTPFKTTQIGMTKVAAMVELIKERRANCTVFPFVRKIENIRELEGRTTTVVDTRDTAPMAGTIATGGYDGDRITMHFNPNPEHIWGDDTPVRYTITPSYIVPPQLIANLIVAYICGKNGMRNPVARDGKECITSFSINKLLTRLMKTKRRITNG
jgi:hypothetical protein